MPLSEKRKQAIRAAVATRVKAMRTEVWNFAYDTPNVLTSRDVERLLKHAAIEAGNAAVCAAEGRVK